MDCHPSRPLFATGALEEDCSVKLWADEALPGGGGAGGVGGAGAAAMDAS